MIEIKNVTRGFGKNRGISEINLTLQPNEIWGLIGNNGAGKSTLIRCLTGLCRCESGEITIDGETCFENPKAKQLVAYQPDESAFVDIYMQKMLVREYSICYDSFSREKFDELNKIVQIGRYKSVSAMSKGQRSMLGLILNLARRPKYLIMDEPESGLDPANQERFHELLLEEVEKQEMGVLISSHNMSAIERLCDKVAIMHEGKIIFRGETGDFLECFQKWSVIWPDEETMNASGFTTIDDWGKISFVITCGDAGENEKLLREKGAKEVEQMQVSLEEAYRYYSPNAAGLAPIIEERMGGDGK